MSAVSCVVAWLLLTAAGGADDRPKPNALTPKEAADGWLSLYDGDTTFGWAVEPYQLPPEYFECKGTGGALVLEGKNGGAGAINCTSPFRHFELVGEYKVRGPWAGFSIDYTPADRQSGTHRGIDLRAAADWTPFGLRFAPDEWTSTVGGTTKREWQAPTGADKDRLVPLVVLSSRMRFFVPEKGNVKLELRNLKLRPLALDPLFNGKDLTGWTVFRGDPKRAAARYAVTPAGELSVTGGPGDLQTDKQAADFVFQAACKTNGPRLNSGVFFRCVPGQYQNGYEAQIHNGYQADDRTKPTDFGTGAIYRRVPARKVVSDDREWFTLTVIAAGSHISTWVNGHQTVDWTDPRPPADNPRQGLRTAKGHLSIQAHDPTTDLLFRDLRLADLPAPERKPPQS